MSVRIYIEGGGPSKGKNTAAKCRQAFHLFFRQFLVRQPHLVACGGRDETFDDFVSARSSSLYREDTIFLLVDSESSVASGVLAKEHLRMTSGWNFRANVSENHVHIMVQCMESWFMADKDAVNKYFEHAHSSDALPQNPNIELISKRDVLDGLKRAARNAGREGYYKGTDSFAILGQINAALVFEASHHARRLRDCLQNALA